MVINAANEEMAPSTPTVLGLNFVTPNAVSGMNMSQEFFKVSINTSLWQLINIYMYLMLPFKSYFTEEFRRSVGFMKVARCKSMTWIIS